MTRVLRQHANTVLHELRGATCESFLAVPHASSRDADNNGYLYLYLYLNLDNTWHRFYIDAGLLFWEDGRAPDAEDDLTEGEAYVDVGDMLGVGGVAVTEIRMADGRLTLSFDGGPRVVLVNRKEDDAMFLEDSELATVTSTSAPKKG